MGTHEERMKEIEKTHKEIHEFTIGLSAHYPGHIVKVVLTDNPECDFCAKKEGVERSSTR